MELFRLKEVDRSKCVGWPLPKSLMVKFCLASKLCFFRKHLKDFKRFERLKK
jgi:hypothetical protein